MVYAKRILSILLVLCLLGNTAITVFASDTDGGDELPPVDTATEEPVVDESPPEQGEEPPAEPSDGEKPTVPEESTEEEVAPEEPTEDVPPEEVTEGEEETTEPPTEEVPAEETIATEEEPTAEITAVSDTVMPMASGVEIVHCGNTILTDAVGTLSFEYYSYLDGAKKTAHTGKRAAENQGATDQAPKGKSCPGCRR